jgi:hypothetical protein
MKKITSFVIFSGLLTCLVPRVEGQTTNVVMVANIALTGVKQAADGTSPVRITTRDILADLNATGGFNFSRDAQLLLKSIEDQLPTFAVRDGTGSNATVTDVSDFLTLSEDVEVHGNNNTTEYASQTVSFDDHNGTSFSVSGMTTLHRRQINSKNIGPLFRVTTASAQLGGSGAIGGATAILHGTLSAGSAKAEVD